MHLLVTGGTGYLGGALLRLAVQQGHRVSATAFQQPPAPVPGVAWHTLDVRDAAAVATLGEQVQPDLVIHTAFRQNDPDMWQVTAQGAAHVAQMAAAVGARLIHLSSDIVFAGTASVPYREDAPLDPITAYGQAKADAERFVQAQHPTAAIVRTSLIYGFDPIDRHTMFVLRVADGQADARLFRDEMRCPIFVADLARALLELHALAFQGIIHIAGDAVVSRYEFGCLLAAHYGRDPATVPAGWSYEHSPPRPRYCALDIGQAQRLLTTPLRGVQHVLEEMS